MPFESSVRSQINFPEKLVVFTIYISIIASKYQYLPEQLKLGPGLVRNATLQSHKLRQIAFFAPK
jgi:hypothetical protein